jgi:molybdopterin converting factor small subunit
MTVTVLLFASYADVLGRERVEMTLPAGATAAEALSRLRALPGGGALPPAPVLGVSVEDGRAEAARGGGEEIAGIPPVAGG